ncbi:MAG: MFS transporter [Steroidobacterales bacterium]
MSTASSSRRARRVVLLLAAAVFINYFDRGNLSTASPLLQKELGLSNVQLGILFSAFFWSYAPFQPVAGWLAQRFDVRYVLGGGLALWALATTLTGLVNSFAAILVLRVLLGIGESAAYPCNAKFLAQRVPMHERSRANGLIAVGQSLGPTCGTLAGGLLMAHFGWRPAFIVLGVLSLAWLVPWRAVTRDGTTAGSGAGALPVDYRILLRERSLWGTSLGHFCGNYAYYFMLTWLPLLLVTVHGFRVDQMAVIGACIYALQAISAPATGWICDRLMLAGAEPNRVLKTTIIIGLCGVAVPMAVCAIAGPTLSIVLLLVSGVFFGVQSAPLGSITQTLGGPRAAGQWMGIQNLCANMAGVLAPLITGFTIGRSDDFFWAFAISALITLAGVLAYAFVIRRVEPVAWPSPSSNAACSPMP